MTLSIDLNAARREANQPDGIPVTFGTEDFILPAEFPVDVLDPFLADEFDLAGLIREAMARAKDADGNTRGIASVVVDTLFERPSLPVEIVKTIFAAYELLFGVEDYARFKSQRPSIGDYARLTGALFEAYGTSLGEAFASPSSSATGGATPSQTSLSSTQDSTPDASGDSQEPATDSSE